MNKLKIKIFFFFSFFLIYFLFIVTPTQANTCQIRIENINSLGMRSGGCLTDETISAENKCPGINPIMRSYNINTMFREVCCCSEAEQEQQQPLIMDPPRFAIPELQVNLGVEFTAPNCFTGDDGKPQCEINWLGLYLTAIYNYALKFGGILAAMMLMAGGLFWLISGGDPGKIKQAKNIISGSLIGLALLFSSYLILEQINPELVVFKPITLGRVGRIEVEGDSSESFSKQEPLALLTEIAKLNCGQDSIKQMVDKTKGKVTYNQSLRGTSGPGNTIYLDCSSYASLILECAGFTGIPSYTGNIFQSRTEFNGDINSLQPGDLVGWPPDSGSGHVFIYLGDGVFGDAHGGSGKNTGNAIGNNFNIKNVQDGAKKWNNGKLYIRKR